MNDGTTRNISDLLMRTVDKNVDSTICNAKGAVIEEQSAIAALQPIAFARRIEIKSNCKLLILWERWAKYKKHQNK